MAFAVTPEGIQAEQARQAELKKALPGHQRESLGSKPPPHRTGELAHGHPVSSEPPGGDPNDPGHVDTHMWLQSLTPRSFPEIRPIVPDQEWRATGSSITEHGNEHVIPVHQFPASDVSQVKPLPGNPTGNPAERRNNDGEMHTAPSGFGQTFRENGKRPSGNPYLPAPGEGGR